MRQRHPRPSNRRRAVSPLATALLAACTLLTATASHAIDYLVEVVVFEQLGETGEFDDALWFPKTGRALSLGDAEAVAAGFETIDTGLSLEANAASIAASGSYRLLRHFAWRQPGLGAREAQAIRLNIGQPFDLYLPDDIAPYDEFIPAGAAPSPDRSRGVRSTTVAGTLKVRLGRFLHMETLLVFTDEEEGRSYRLAESRRMRSTELHFIDNPRFGILTRILPIEEPES